MLEIDKARALLVDLADTLGDLLDDKYRDAIAVVLDDHARLAESRINRTGKRERVVMEYMETVPKVPMTPKSVELALELDYSVATAMDNLAKKGRLQRLGKHAVYRYNPEN